MFLFIVFTYCIDMRLTHLKVCYCPLFFQKICRSHRSYNSYYLFHILLYFIRVLQKNYLTSYSLYKILSLILKSQTLYNLKKSHDLYTLFACMCLFTFEIIWKICKRLTLHPCSNSILSILRSEHCYNI